MKTTKENLYLEVNKLIVDDNITDNQKYFVRPVSCSLVSMKFIARTVTSTGVKYLTTRWPTLVKSLRPFRDIATMKELAQRRRRNREIVLVLKYVNLDRATLKVLRY